MNELEGQNDQECRLSSLQSSELPAVLSAMLQSTSPQLHERQYGEVIDARRFRADGKPPFSVRVARVRVRHS
jgi:hypothetical protein